MFPRFLSPAGVAALPTKRIAVVYVVVLWRLGAAEQAVYRLGAAEQTSVGGFGWWHGSLLSSLGQHAGGRWRCR